MKMQRAVFALSVATFCLVVALLFVVLRQRPENSREVLSQAATNSTVAARQLPAPQPAQTLRRTSPPREADQSFARGVAQTRNTVIEPLPTPPETQPLPPVLPPPQKEPISAVVPVGGSQGSPNGATIIGTVQWQGAVPKPKRIRVDTDPFCAQMHPDPLFAENIVVNENKTLRNVFVYVSQGLEAFTFEAPKTAVTLDQRGCQYQPHVLGIMARQPLKIVNSDNTLHNIHVLAKINQEFNVGQPNLGMEKLRAFAQPEVMIPVKCDVHPWMRAYIGVLEHPFYSVTGDTGLFQISGLPSGNYLVEAWHEVYGVQTQLVSVAGQETKEVTFTFGQQRPP